jgi:hypothetical protein
MPPSAGHRLRRLYRFQSTDRESSQTCSPARVVAWWEARLHFCVFTGDKAVKAAKQVI